jgi:hypothetical protein
VSDSYTSSSHLRRLSTSSPIDPYSPLTETTFSIDVPTCISHTYLTLRQQPQSRARSCPQTPSPTATPTLQRHGWRRLKNTKTSTTARPSPSRRHFKSQTSSPWNLCALCAQSSVTPRRAVAPPSGRPFHLPRRRIQMVSSSGRTRT